MIEIKGLKKSFGAKNVLGGVSLSIPSGSVFGLVGINGAGKSTLLRLIAGVLRADEGKILADGEEIFENEKKKREFFFLPDDPYYATGTNADKLIGLYKTFYDFDAAVFAEYEKRFSIKRNVPIRNFSKGMKRQLFIAIALACRPKYLLLDEAFDGLGRHLQRVRPARRRTDRRRGRHSGRARKGVQIPDRPAPRGKAGGSPL